MFPYASIHPEVASAATDLLRFDYYRLVDPRDHRVFAYDRDGDRLIEVDGPCYQLWNQDDPCLNCSSRACLTMQDAVFKIEYLDGRVLHVTSVPMDIEGAELVLELIKDVTDSLLQHVVEVNGISYIQVHPTFLYESLWNLILLILLILFTKHKRFDGEVFLLYLAGYGIGRFWIESLRTDQLLLPVIGYPVSMALAALLVVVSVSWIIIWHVRQHKKTA